MVHSAHHQSLAGGGFLDDPNDDGVLVQEDELLVSDQDISQNDARGRSSSRVSRTATRSEARPGWTRTGDLLGGKYLVEVVRGRSGPEMVVVARHLELGQRVGFRYLLPEASASPEAIARFQRGARKAREMRSEHAERVIDYGRLENGSPYRVTVLPSGPSLEEMLRVRGALGVAEAADVLIAACEPVAEAHASGFVHRSLTPANIYVERRPDGSQMVKVLDFGVADPLEPDPAQSDELRLSGTEPVVGSLAYASPEQIRNAAVDARTDVWALGAVLYELLTGVRVFEAETPLTLLAMIAADQPAPISWLQPDVPEELERIVLSCLEKDPNARPRSVVELATALAPFGSQDAHGVAGRVARIAMRSTRPPPLPSSLRPSTAPSSTPASMRSRAIVRSTPPLTQIASEKPNILPNWATLTGGALIGVCGALASALVLRLQLPQPAAPVANVAPAAAPVVAPVPAAPAPTNTNAVESPVATTATAPVTQPAKPSAPAAAPARVAPTRAERRTPAEAKEEPPAAIRPAPAKRESPAPAAEPVAAGRAPAAPNGLFGSVD